MNASNKQSLSQTLLWVFFFYTFWNAVSSHFTGYFTDFYRKVKKDFYFNLILAHSRSSRRPGSTVILNTSKYSMP